MRLKQSYNAPKVLQHFVYTNLIVCSAPILFLTTVGQLQFIRMRIRDPFGVKARDVAVLRRPHQEVGVR